MFDKILIANRGEIACRIARTAKRLGVQTLGIYAPDDARARHVTVCDEAVALPGVGAAAYLNGKAVIAAARAHAACAIHPGYGFLSENADFAASVARAKLVFIGPDAAAIRKMAVKNEAKKIMQQIGVPVLAGDVIGDDLRAAKKIAERVKYPLLLKAVSGGGGKGMRVVRNKADFGAALDSVRREARAAFADARVMCEQYLPRARHVEVQIFADQFGNVAHLGERDCSLQRRQQKVIEESPAANLARETRDALHAAAVNAARAINYVGAGTVEFLVTQDAKFYFLEMNTRLQVEHGVTELVCDEDLVEWQLRVAAGETLPKAQSEIRVCGHAMQARVCAESPANDFLPAIGQLQVYRRPRGVRVDDGVRVGDEISPHYDSLIAKVLVKANTRDAARRKLMRALDEFAIVGADTNVNFLSALCRMPEFVGGDLAAGLHTRVIEARAGELLAQSMPPDEIWTAAALCLGELPGWRMNLPATKTIRLRCGLAERDLVVRAERAQVFVDDEKVALEKIRDDEWRLQSADRQIRLRVHQTARGVRVTSVAGGWDFSVAKKVSKRKARAPDAQGDAKQLLAPMPGRVIALHVKSGERVKAGAALVVMEAMKMEHTIKSPREGRIGEIFYREGAQVPQGGALLQFT